MSVAISNGYAIVGAANESEDANGENTLSNAGSVYIFVQSGETWTQQQKIVAFDRETSDYFGCSVDIDGDYVIVGAYDEDEDTSGTNSLNSAGSAYIFTRNINTWSQQQKIVADDRAESNWFGYSVAISGDHAIIGAYREGWNTGAAYIFARNTTSWVQEQKIIASSRETFDYFGHSVDISGDYAIVGADEENEDANEENTLFVAGAAYIFKKSEAAVKIGEKIIPTEFSIQNIYPNPFNPRTVISLHYATGCNSVINIDNVQGVPVKKLINGYVEAGNYDLTWDASDMPSAVYIVRMVAGDFIASQKIVLIK